MAVTMAEITKLRQLTSAGLMDCKKALAETDGDIEAAVEILRKKGQAVAAKRDWQAASSTTIGIDGINPKFFSYIFSKFA